LRSPWRLRLPLRIDPPAGMNCEQNAPGAAGPKDSGVVQRGRQPNPAEVRPGNRDGDAPSAASGELVPREGRRILGLPVDAALIIAGVLIGLALIARPGHSRHAPP